VDDKLGFSYHDDLMKKRTPQPQTTRAWQRMLSGRRLDLIDPHSIDIEIEDIALGLSRVARWNGQTKGQYAFSVAQHSLIVEEFVRRLKPNSTAADSLSALLHDASEYVIGDMISPFKSALGVDYRRFEDQLEQAIHVRFGLKPIMNSDLKALIKQADRLSAHCEAVQLVGFQPAEASSYFGPAPTWPMPLFEPLPAHLAEKAYLERFLGLIDGL